MGKYSTPKYPSYSGGTLKINGKTKASTSKKGNNIVSNYKMSDAEKSAYNYAQKSLAQNLPYINVFDKNTQAELQSQLDAYTQKGQDMINKMYTPVINNLKTDIASRFGNFDNSAFLNNLNSVESNRAEAMNSFAQDVLNRRDELVNNELSQRYTYLNFLQDLQNQTNSNLLSLIGISQNNSNLGNNYNSQSYNAQLQNSRSGNMFSNLGSTIGSSMMTSGNPYLTAAGIGLSAFS